MYNWIVVVSRSHKVYDCLVGVSWSVEPGLKVVNESGEKLQKEEKDLGVCSLCYENRSN